MPFRTTYFETLKLLGFRSGGDLLASTLGLKLYSWGVFKGLALGAVIAGLTAFCTRWIWNPPSALYLLLFLDVANGHYGYQVSKKLRKVGFRWVEFQRLGGIMIATLITMGIVRNAINSYPYYEVLADIVFGWLFATKAKKVVSKMIALKVQEQGAASLFQYALKSLLQSKLGALVVDEAQRRPESATNPTPADESPAAPVPAPPEGEAGSPN